MHEWATRNGFKFAAQKCKVLHFTAPISGFSDPLLLGLVIHLCQWRSRRNSSGFGGSCPSLSRSTSGCWRPSARRPSILCGWGGDRDTLLMLYRAIVRSKLDYGCILYGTASNTNLQQLDSIHKSGLGLALGAFCTSQVSSLYTEANEGPLEERRLKLSMHYYVKARACINNPAHHALHEFGRTTRDLYAPRTNGRGGMTRLPASPVGLKVKEAMTPAEINARLVCSMRTPYFPPGIHDYDPKRHDLIEGVSKCMISRQEAQAKFNEYRKAQGSHDEVYTDGFKMNERVGAAAVINRHFQNGETTCHQLSKRLPDNNTILTAEATAINLALNYYQHMGPAHHDVVVNSDSMPCLQGIEPEDIENPFICHIMNRLWWLSDKGTHVRFCWIPSHCGLDGNERVDQLAKETFIQDNNPLASVHYTNMKPLVNSDIGSNQVGCSCTWQRTLSCETNTGATNEIPAPNQSWKGCNHATSNWPYQGHQIPYLVPRTADWLSLLWSNTDHWLYAPGVCIATGMLWWILHSRLIECSLLDNSWDLHSGIPARSRILLSDMM